MSPTVLLVDDSGLARRSTRRILEGAGYTVLEADDGLSALEQYSLKRPDVVLLDLVMRGMHGLDVLARLRELDPEAKVVVISADVQTSSRDLVREAGAAGFLNKPVNPAEVLDAVSRVTRGERPPWN
jgi:two-component system, chemotaxis family, chemotaxis protein CheY